MGTGSTGAHLAERLQALCDKYNSLLPEAQSSAQFMDWYNNLSSIVPADSIPAQYVIGGGETNSPEGWWSYLRRMAASTRNTSTQSASGQLGLPSETWRDFLGVIEGMTPAGLASSAVGKRLYNFITNRPDLVATNCYELFLAWTAWGGSTTWSS